MNALASASAARLASASSAARVARLAYRPRRYDPTPEEMVLSAQPAATETSAISNPVATSETFSQLTGNCPHAIRNRR